MDTIANMLIQIKNAGRAKKKETEVKFSKINLAILNNLKNQGYINNFKTKENNHQKYPSKIIVNLKYKNQDEPYLSEIIRVSSPGRRIYTKSSKLPKLSRGGQSEFFISTSEGIMTGKEAHKKGLGGEVICEVK